MARIFLTNIDLQNNQIVNMVAERLAVDPSTPAIGRIVYNTTSNKLEYWNGTAWVLLDNASAAYATDADRLDSQHGTYYLERANHTGTQLASTISNFDSQVRAIRIDQMAAPTAPVSLGSQKITNLATPTSSADAVNKSYVDSLGYNASVGNGVLTTITVTHNLNSRDILVNVWQTSPPYGRVECDIVADTVNSIQLSFMSAPTNNQYRVCVRKT